MTVNPPPAAPLRVRFAPSPTGHLHIGGARTALFNWLFARRLGGTFILRIEDTDLQRSTQESVDAIIDNLRWLGLDWDEGPILQSSRFPLYAPQAERLVAEGRAYRSDDRKGAKPAIILKKPEREIAVDDIVHGRMVFSPDAVGDLVLMKSDGTPTYNFACVVDDAAMGITHIIRGDDPYRHVALFEALGAPVPKYAHLPMIVNQQGKPYSKRDGDAYVGDFRDKGYLPDALFNYLVLLGWSPGDDREVLAREEIAKLFTLDRVQSSPAKMDLQKLLWMNGEYMARLPI